jgi:hypothetical protein
MLKNEFLFFTAAVWVLLAFLAHQGCQKNKLEALPFFEVFTRPLTGRLESATLRGEVTGLNEDIRPDAVGFLYNTDLEALQSAVPSGNTLTAVLLPGGNFEARFEGFEATKSYYFRAFAAIGERRLYGNVQVYRLGDIVVTGAIVVKNDSAFLSGVFSGLQVTGDTITEYGYVLSHTTPNPALGCSDCITVTERATVSADGPFSGKVGDLRLNTLYHLRAYAKGKNKVFYSAARSFPVADGWKRMPGLPAFQEGVAISSNGEGYAGFGCDVNTNCLQNTLPADFWKFTPDPNTTTGGSWSRAGTTPSLYLRTKTASFTIGDTIYFAGGAYYDAFCTNEPCLVFDFLKFDTKSQSWSTGDSDTIRNRSGAVAFALNGRGYVGAGEGSDGTRIVSLNDFWEYTPANGRWRKVAALPLRRSASDPVRYTAGRTEAAAFAVDQFAYVGAGRLGLDALTDFWRFHPPVDPADTGRWEQIQYFRGIGRSAPVAFSIKSKGYVGMGFNITYGELKDFWEYDPARNEWLDRAPFPPGRRHRAVGFSIGPYGYAGTGLSRLIETGTNIVTNDGIHGDIWRYEPR